MNVRERAAALAAAASNYPELSPPGEEDLRIALLSELGSEEILETFCPRGAALSRAVPPRTILHVVSGNTTHAALQTLLRGLLLGSHNLVKLPSRGLEEIADFARFLPKALAERVVFSRELGEEWKTSADAWVVFGSDETVEALRRECPPDCLFQAHGHRLSFAAVFEDPDFISCDAAARDVSLFDQSGCLSPHVIYVRHNPREYAARLAAAMEAFAADHPPSVVSPEERVARAAQRETWEFEAANHSGIEIWNSHPPGRWTVVYEESPEFRVSPLGRFVFVKPLPKDWPAAVGAIRRWVGGIGIYPAASCHAETLSGLGASRICALGSMQTPPFSWHADGLAPMASLVRWVDFEPGF